MKEKHLWHIYEYAIYISPKIYNSVELNNTEREKWAYLAGLIDGDGCISLTKRGTRVHYKPTISFVNTDEELVKWVSGFLGKNHYRVGKANPKKNQKQTFQVVIQGRGEVKHILEKMVPFIIRKKPQAKLCIEYYGLQKWRRGLRDPLLPREQEIFIRMKSLNRVGVKG